MVGENNSGNKSILERIANKDGNEHFKVTNNQAKQGQNMGKSIHLHCLCVGSTLNQMEKQHTSKLCSDV